MPGLFWTIQYYSGLFQNVSLFQNRCLSDPANLDVTPILLHHHSSILHHHCPWLQLSSLQPHLFLLPFLVLPLGGLASRAVLTAQGGGRAQQEEHLGRILMRDGFQEKVPHETFIFQGWKHPDKIGARQCMAHIQGWSKSKLEKTGESSKLAVIG